MSPPRRKRHRSQSLPWSNHLRVGPSHDRAEAPLGGVSGDHVRRSSGLDVLEDQRQQVGEERQLPSDRRPDPRRALVVTPSERVHRSEDAEDFAPEQRHKSSMPHEPLVVPPTGASSVADLEQRQAKLPSSLACRRDDTASPLDRPPQKFGLRSCILDLMNWQPELRQPFLHRPHPHVCLSWL